MKFKINPLAPMHGEQESNAEIAKKLIGKARARMIIKTPFFASLCFGLEPWECPHIVPTSATDGSVFGYNPDYIANLTVDQVIGEFAACVLKSAYLHHIRIEGRDPAMFNVASALAVNHILKNEYKFTMPDDTIIIDKFKDMSAEEIYRHLPKPGKGGAGGGQGKQQQGGAPPPPNSANVMKHGSLRNQKEGSAPDASPKETKSESENKWKDSVLQALQNAKMLRGTVPGDMERAITEMIAPEPDLCARLRDFADRVARTDYNWMRPNRRYQGMGIVMPSQYSNTLGPLALVIDTSGSVDQTMLDEAAGELQGILNVYDTEITVIYCDAQVQGTPQVYTQRDELKLRPAGGGGTDFRPAFKWIEKNIDDCVAIIYITDLCGTFPKESPNDIPTLWVQKGSNSHIPVPFGEVIRKK